jgi:hypothetical protein|tara:strand:- start:247 stop:468 length:222 start_codon:yes stop_codon:yes gene_type:complete
MTQADWEKEQIKNSEGMSSLTDEQRETLNDTFDVLQEFLREYREMFDVTSETARKMHNVYWAYINEFNKIHKY